MSYPPHQPPPYYGPPQYPAQLPGSNSSPYPLEHANPYPVPGLMVPVPMMPVAMPVPNVSMPMPSVSMPMPSVSMPMPSVSMPMPVTSTNMPIPSMQMPLASTQMPSMNMPIPSLPTSSIPMESYPVSSLPMQSLPISSPPEHHTTYITNYIYHNDGHQSDQIPKQDYQLNSEFAEIGGEFNWVPSTATTAGHLSGKAVLGGHEGWDGSPLWVIRAWHNRDLIPGKLSVRHNKASVTYNGKEVPVQNVEVLCSKSEKLRWIPASNGSIPPGAVPGGKTSTGEVLYVGRVRYQLSVTPGKVQPSQNCCYIAFGASEISQKMYDVLCRLN